MRAELSQDRAGTRERILESAEALFAERGFESVSLRDITGAAEVNVAAVNYHFGSKENLIEAVVERHATPINHERLRMLDEAEQRYGEEAVPVREILEAFLSPMLNHILSGEMAEELFCKFMGRLIGERGHCLPESVWPLFQTMAGRFSMALRKSVPALSEELALWRMHYSFGVMANTLTHGDALREISGGRCGTPEMEDQFRQIIDFCEAGILAEPSAGGGDE